MGGLALGFVILGLAGVVRAQAALAARLDRLELTNQTGSRASYPVAGDLLSVPPSVREIAGERAGLMLVVAPNCGVCRRAIEELEKAQDDLGLGVFSAILFRGSRYGYDGPIPTFADMDDVLFRLGIAAAPFAIAIAPSGAILASAPLPSRQDARTFFTQVAQLTEATRHADV